MSASSLAKAVIDGILTGGVYALMAAGLTLIFGVMDIINIAQGALIVLGAYMSYVLSVHLGIDLFAGLLITIPAFFVLGVFIEWAFMRRLRDQERTAMSILVTYAVAIIIEGVLSVIFGVDYVQLNASYVNSTFHILGFYLPYIYVFGFLLAIALIGVLYYILYRTHFGRGVRGSLQNRSAAELIGINVNRVRAVSVGIGVSVTAAGGMVFGATNSFTPSSGYDLISRLLSIVVLAGPGQHRRRADRGDLHGHARGRGRGRVVAGVGDARLLRVADRRALVHAERAVRQGGGPGAMTPRGRVA